MALTEFVDLANEMLEQDVQRDKGYSEIDRAVNVEYENPEALKRLSWIGNRTFPTTAFSDAAKAATRAFATKRPKLSIHPAYDDYADYAQIEKLETAMEWEFERINRIGTKPVHWQIVESAMKYCAVAIQIEYLPYLFRDKKYNVIDLGNGVGEQVEDRRVKSIMRQSHFVWHVHNPATVHTLQSKYGLEAVCKAVNMSAEELIQEFGADNPGVQLLKQKFDGKNRADRISTNYSLFDITTWDRRVIWACESAGTQVRASSSEFVFMDAPHNLPFIPWVVVDNQDPILLPALRAGLFDNANMLNTIAFSKAIDMAAHPELWIRTIDGSLNNVHIDNTNPSQPLVTDKTAEVQQLRPPAIDPQLTQMQEQARADVFRSAVAQVLADISNIGGQATFSTVNAMLEAALSQLSLGQNAAERAETLAFYQMFQWIEYSDEPMIAYRKHRKGSSMPGQELVIKPNYTGTNTNIATFDLDMLYLDVKLQSTSITDKQAELNNEVLKVERLGKSRAAAREALGEGSYEQDFEQRSDEDLALAEVQAEATRIMQGPQMEMLQAQQQAEMERQAAEAENAQKQQRGEIFSPTEGMDNRTGAGAGAAAAVPGASSMTQTGQLPGGGGLV